MTHAARAAQAQALALPALQAALAAEHAAVYGYGIVGAMLSGTEQAAALTDWKLHQEARDTLEAMIVKLGGTPVAAGVAYRLPFAVLDAQSARRLAVTLEDGVTQAYLGLVAVTDQRLRIFGALAMQPPANRAAAWRGSTVAFPGMPSGPVTRVLLPAVRQGEHPRDGGRGRVQVVGDRDPLRPRPPEPPEAVLAAADVHVLFQRPGSWVGHVHAGHSSRRRHEPGLKPPVRQLLGQLVKIDGFCVVPLGFHSNHHRYIS